MRIFWLGLLLAAPGAAQSFHWGLLGGTVIQTPYFPQINESVAFTPGALVEFRLPGPVAIEANAIYRRQGYAGPFNVVPERDDVVGGLTSRSNVFDLPVLLKYRKPVQDFVNIFLSSGYARRWRSESFRVSGVRGSDAPVPVIAGVSTRQNGYAIGGGAELDGGTLRMSIGYRYSRFGEFRHDKSHDVLVSFIF
jgi:hypothetical protein